MRVASWHPIQYCPTHQENEELTSGACAERNAYELLSETMQVIWEETAP